MRPSVVAEAPAVMEGAGAAAQVPPSEHADEQHQQEDQPGDEPLSSPSGGEASPATAGDDLPLPAGVENPPLPPAGEEELRLAGGLNMRRRAGHSSRAMHLRC